MPKKCKKYSIVCEACGSIIIVNESRKGQRFCSIKCYFSKSENNPFYGKHHSRESKKKLSFANSGKKRSEITKKLMSCNRTGNKNGFYGKKHSDKTKQQISQRGIERDLSGENNPFYGKCHSPEIRRHLSEVRSRKILSGEINPINTSRKGYFNGIRYDSTYELKRIQQLLSDNHVKLFQKNNNIIIDYEFEGKKRKYIPDFFIEYYDGSKVVEEIKGYEKPVDKVKYKAAKHQLQLLGIEYKILYKKDIFNSNKEYREFLRETRKGKNGS
jgi:hypothetical protein